MLYLIPRKLPTWAQTWEALGRPHSATLAASLGVDDRTVRRWHAAQAAPAPVMLSLYWLTPWGQSDLSAEQHNRATTACALVDAQRRELAQLRAHVARLESALLTYARPAASRPVPAHARPAQLRTAATVPAS